MITICLGGGLRIEKSTDACWGNRSQAMKGETVADVSQRLLAHHGGLRGSSAWKRQNWRGCAVLSMPNWNG
jgi:hypothetical protein